MGNSYSIDSSSLAIGEIMGEIHIGLYLIIGIIFLFGGAEALIKGGASLALRIGLPVLVVALTIMGYGTGTPELIVSIQASLSERGDIVIGNVIGSNIANIGLILGFSAIFRPVSIRSQLAKHDGPVMVIVTLLLCLILAFTNEICRWKGALFFGCLLLHTWWTIRLGRREKKVEKELREELSPQTHRLIIYDLFLIVGGLVFLFLGGQLFLEGAVSVAKLFDISDAVIGLTVVAIGTSLPEFATSLVAIYRKHEDVALGNIVGSNIFNILAIVGVSSLIHPIYLHDISWVDYTYLAILTFFLWAMIQARSKLTRWEGALMLTSYLLYMGYLYQN